MLLVFRNQIAWDLGHEEALRAQERSAGDLRKIKNRNLWLSAHFWTSARNLLSMMGIYFYLIGVFVISLVRALAFKLP